MKDDMCDTHTAEVVSMYCTGCSAGVCRLCLCKETGRHVGHVVIPLEKKTAMVEVCVITTLLWLNCFQERLQLNNQQYSHDSCFWNTLWPIEQSLSNLYVYSLPHASKSLASSHTQHFVTINVWGSFRLQRVSDHHCKLLEMYSLLDDDGGTNRWPIRAYASEPSTSCMESCNANGTSNWFIALRWLVL